jgi:hypothetical protein
MNQSNRCCTICGPAKKGVFVYKILEDVSIWDKNIDLAQKPYICEGCLYDLILDIERYVDTKPVFKPIFRRQVQ